MHHYKVYAYGEKSLAKKRKMSIIYIITVDLRPKASVHDICMPACLHVCMYVCKHTALRR